MLKKIYEKVLESLIRYEGDHRKEFIASFLAGILIDDTKSFAALVRKKLGIPLLLDFNEAYGKISWWFFNDELREKSLEAIRFALTNIDYRNTVLELAKDGAKTRVYEAMKYLKEKFPDDNNVAFVLDNVSQVKAEDKKYELKCEGKVTIAFLALTWGLDPLATAFNKPYLKFVPRKDRIEIPDELIEISENCGVRAKIHVLNLDFLEEEKGKDAYESYKYVIIIVPKDHEKVVIDFMSRWSKSLSKAKALGFVLLSGKPISFEKDFIENFELIPLFVGESAKSILYNVSLIALESLKGEKK